MAISLVVVNGTAAEIENVNTAGDDLDAYSVSTVVFDIDEAVDDEEPAEVTAFIAETLLLLDLVATEGVVVYGTDTTDDAKRVALKIAKLGGMPSVAAA